jgi:hypothetical protein
MAWARIRSRRDPAFWAPLGFAVLVGPALGLAAQLWLADRLRRLQALAATDPASALVAAEHVLRGLGWLIGGFALLSSGLLARYFQLGLQQGRLPPFGWWWSLGAHRAATGATARRLGRAGLCLAALLGLLGIATVFLVNHLIQVLLATRST